MCHMLPILSTPKGRDLVIHSPVIHAGWKPNPVGRVPAADGQQGLACYPVTKQQGQSLA